MEERFGKMTVTVWLGLPVDEETRAEVGTDQYAGQIALAEMAQAIALGAIVTGGTPVLALEITEACAEVSAETWADYEQRARAELAAASV